MANLSKIATRLLADDIAEGLAEAAEWGWIFCDCSMCAACDVDHSEWGAVPSEWQWVRYAPRRWIEPKARAA